MKKRLPAMNCLTGLLGVLLLVASQDSLAVTVTLDPTVTGNVQLVAGSFVLTENPNFLLTQQDLSINTDLRSFLEFPLASVPSDFVIEAATLRLFVSSSDPAEVPVFGYAGDGGAEVNDAVVTTNLLGASDPLTQFEFIDIDLDADFIAGLVNSSTSHLGLLLMGDANGLQASFNNISENETPVLNLSLRIPGDFDLDDDVDGFDFLLWQRGEVSSPPSADDLLDWENNYGTTATLAAITSVPEPTSLCFVLLGALGLLANRAICGYFSSRLQPPASSPSA